MACSRRIEISDKIPKGLLIQDIEQGGFRKYRISYSYCLDCGRVIDGWQKGCACTGKYKMMNQSWVDMNWNYLVGKMELRKRHGIPFRWG